MRSVTEQAALDEFLSTAELAGTDFTAEKLNTVKVIHRDQRNPYLLSEAEERVVARKHNANRQRLTVPRRPPWDETTTPRELDVREKEAFLDWRRGLAELQESDDLLMTSFERNLEVWRQLWRVIERSDLIVQIVDARNPLLFRAEDLEKYVVQVDARKKNLLLVNKADMLTLKQRRAWADYFTQNNIDFRFFSAELAKEMNEARNAEPPSNTAGVTEDSKQVAEQNSKRTTDQEARLEVKRPDELQSSKQANKLDPTRERKKLPEEDFTRIITTEELEDVFLKHAPAQTVEDETPARKVSIGMVGYPNVGKSSTINALIGSKKVSVSATPGKTKHFQTVHLSDSVVLCDCPGLVFPNFATTKAELVCNGILPIDQLREFTGPAALVAQRIPQPYLEAIYGMKIKTRPLEEGGTGIPTAEELLAAYATARGFQTQGLGQPDGSRAARYVLKDYVKGKLLYCHPPPPLPSSIDGEASTPFDGREFNQELYGRAHLPLNRQRHMTLDGANADDEEVVVLDRDSAQSSAHFDSQTGRRTTATNKQQTQSTGSKSSRLDKKFFGPPHGDAGHLTMPFHSAAAAAAAAAATNTNSAPDSASFPVGKQLTGRKERVMLALEKGVDPSELRAMGGKKHFKGQKRKDRVVRSSEFD